MQKLKDISKLCHSFCIAFIILSFSCFEACSNFLQHCSLTRSLMKILLSNIVIFMALISICTASIRCYVELCPYLVAFAGWQRLSVVPTSVVTGPTTQSSVDDSIPQFLNKESISVNKVNRDVGSISNLGDTTVPGHFFQGGIF